MSEALMDNPAITLPACVLCGAVTDGRKEAATVQQVVQWATSEPWKLIRHPSKMHA